MLSKLQNSLEPVIVSLFKEGSYSWKNFQSDIIAGLMVAIVALPLAMAIAIASNLPPEKGLLTAIVAGFMISIHSGSRYQIGGPTAAFIVTVSTVIMHHGYDGLVIATFMAGIILIGMALVNAGDLVKFIPYPVIVGFTSGIALLIAFSQIRDLFGLKITAVPPDFIDKLFTYVSHIDTINSFSLGMGILSIFIILFSQRFIPKFPAALIVVFGTAFLTWGLSIPVETIESRFGTITTIIPQPIIPHISFDRIRLLLPDAITIATLAAIESLLSAVVADGMTETRHKPNAELLGQGLGNIASGIFGGLPATGAIARTATNIKAGATSPISGILHTIWLLFFILLLSPFIVKIPLSALAAILLVIAWNMSEIKHFKEILKAPKNDQAILIITFLLTVLVDLNFAIQAGIALASILFINQMMHTTNIYSVTKKSEGDDPDSIINKIIPKGVEIYEIEGPLFFGITEKVVDSISLMEKPAKIFILRMRYVPFIDAAGIHTLEVLHKRLESQGTTLILSGVNPTVRRFLSLSPVEPIIGADNITDHIDKALLRSQTLLSKGLF